MGPDGVKKTSAKPLSFEQDLDVEEKAELVLFHVKECYVYLIPPRKSAASYRADEWDINKWNWEGALRVVSKGEECFIRLEDNSTGELYAQAIVRPDEPVPLEAVIDSSRFFVLRIEDTSSSSSKQKRHAFIGLGLRERPQAYDFQAAIYDHVKYLNRKKEAEEMEQEYQSKPSVDYSLKEGETLRLQIKTPSKASSLPTKTGKRVDTPLLQENVSNLHLTRQASSGGVPILGPPPPPLSPLSQAQPVPATLLLSNDVAKELPQKVSNRMMILVIFKKLKHVSPKTQRRISSARLDSAGFH